MVDIIIVGCGTQGWVHTNCYAKLKDMFNIRIVGVVDLEPKQLSTFKHSLIKLGFDTQKIIFKNTLSEISKELDISNSIVDIVTPNNCHYPIAKTAVGMGARKIIIEKPSAHEILDANNIEKLSGVICMVENYLFSSVTQYIQRYIKEHELKPLFVKTEFSKDRRLDSLKGRGISEDYIPHVFTIEIPHQIAIVSYLLGFPKYVYDAWCNDMILPDGRICNHGEGAITLAHNNEVTTYNFSCLQGFRHLSIAYRTIRVYCEDNIKIFGYYSTTIDLEGSVLVYRDKNLIESRRFTDDSMTATFKYMIECFIENKEPLNNANFGRKIMEIIDTSKVLTEKFR